MKKEIILSFLILFLSKSRENGTEQHGSEIEIQIK